MVAKWGVRCSALVAAGGCAELARLVDVVQELSLARSAGRIIEILGEAAERLLRADAACLLLREGEHWYYADDAATGPPADGDGTSVSVFLSSLVMEQRQPVAIEDLQADPRIPAGVHRFPRTQSALMVPVRPTDPVGAIGVYWAERHAARENETQFLQVLADATSGALETVQAYASLETRVMERTAELEQEVAERREAERRLELALKAGRMGVWEFDVRDGLVRSNEEQLRMLGYRPADVHTGAEWARLIHRADRATVLAGLRALAEGRQAEYRGEFRLRTKPGAWHWILSQAMVAERDARGRALRVIGTHMDIDGQKQAHLALREALAEAEARRRVLDALMEHIPLGIAIADADGTVRAVSRYGQEMMQCSGEQLGHVSDLLQAGWTICRADGVTPAGIDEWPLTRAMAKGERIQEEELLVTRPGGRRVHMLCTAAPIRDAQGRITGGVVAWQDMSQHKRDELTLRDSEERFRATFEQAAVGVAHVSPSGHWLRVNAKLSQMLGYSCEELRYRTTLDVTHPDDKTIGQDAYKRLFAGEIDSATFEKRYLNRDGTAFWARATVSCACDLSGEPKYTIAVIEDISETRTLQERIRQLAQHDSLTGLANRALVHEFGEHLLARVRRGPGGAALLFIDLDRFKPINDTYGHNLGDEVLKEVARRLQKCVRGEDVVGRLGGDEFVVMLAHMHSESDVVKAAGHILHTLGQPYGVRGLELDVSPSIGISLFPHDGSSVDELIKNADTAMYHAKNSGRNRIQFFRPDLDEIAQESLRMESRLRHALEEGEFVLHYQTIHDTQTAAVVAAEAFIRWPAMSADPDRFLPLAEAAGYGQELGGWVVREACRQQRAWRTKGLLLVPVSVNVSAGQFTQKGFAESVREAVGPAEADRRALCVEVPESAVMKDVEQSARTLRALHEAGVVVALSGCSGWSSLGRLPLDILKLHPAIVRNVGRDRASAAIADAMIGLGRSLGMELIAEGVESAEVVDFLRARECRKGQGFYFSRPMPADEFESAWLKAA